MGAFRDFAGPPRVGGVGAVLVLSMTGAVATTACESANEAQVTPPIVLAIGATEQPVYDDGTLIIYSSRLPVPLPVKQPTGKQLSALQPDAAPYTHSPYLLTSDETVEVDYTVTNLDNVAHAVWMLLEPWNEFVQYRPSTVDEPALAGFARPIVLAPLGRVQGNITPPQMSTVAVRLDTAMRITSATFGPDAGFGEKTLLARDFDPQVIPGPTDPLLAKFVPTVVAGLTGFDLALEAFSPMNVAIEVTITVIDASGQGKILPPGTTRGVLGAPPTLLQVQNVRGATLTPPPPRR